RTATAPPAAWRAVLSARLPDRRVQLVGGDEVRELAGAPVGLEELLDVLLARPSRPGARHDSRDVPFDRAGADVLEVVPQQPRAGAEEVADTRVAVESLRRKRGVEHQRRQLIQASAKLGRRVESREPVPNTDKGLQLARVLGQR